MRVLAAAAAALSIGATGCGMMFNGISQSVEVTASDPEAEIISNGTVVGKGKATVTGSPSDPPSVFVRGKDGGTVQVPIESSVGAGWVVLDVICGLTIIGLAAPLTDAMFDGWTSLDGPVDVKVVKAAPRAPRSIEYAKVTASDPSGYAATKAARTAAPARAPERDAPEASTPPVAPVLDDVALEAALVRLQKSFMTLNSICRGYDVSQPTCLARGKEAADAAAEAVEAAKALSGSTRKEIAARAKEALGVIEALQVDVAGSKPLRVRTPEGETGHSLERGSAALAALDAEWRKARAKSK